MQNLMVIFPTDKKKPSIKIIYQLEVKILSTLFGEIFPQF